MSTHRDNVLTSVHRARDFINLHIPALPEDQRSLARDDLDIAAKEIARCRVYYEVSLASVATLSSRIRTLRYALVTTCLRPIATALRTARAEDIELGAVIIPAHDASAARLILTANTLADVITRHQEAFLCAGLPSGTVPRLRRLASKLREEVTSLDSAVVRRQRDTDMLDTAGQRGRTAIRMLDALVRDYLAADPALITLWAETKCIRHAASAPLVLRRDLRRRRA